MPFLTQPLLALPRARPSRTHSVLAAGSAALLTAVLAVGCSSASAGTAVSAHSGRSAAAALTGLPPPRPAVAHWGSFFGASKGIFDVATTPVTIKLPGTVAQVGSSNSTQYALLTNGSLYAWGMGNAGQLGDGGTASSFTAAVRVAFPRGVQIAWIPADVMPYDTGLAVDTDGRVWGWGLNAGGELCTGNERSFRIPVRLPLAPVTAVAGASNHALYDAAGTVYACGQNVEGDLGDGSTRDSTVPVRVAGLRGSAVAALTASFANSGALLASGAYLDWGYNTAGQLGDGRSGKPSDVPVQVKLPRPARQVALGGSIWNNGQSLALLSDGSLWSWGNDRACQLGDHRFRPRSTPAEVRQPAGVQYRSIATGSATSYAVSAAGNVYAWGVSHVGQLGDGSTAMRCTPVLVQPKAALISATANNVVVSLAGDTAASGG